MAARLTGTVSRELGRGEDGSEAHARAVLEFPAVLESVAELAVTPPGADRVRDLLPSIEPDEVGRRLERLTELLGVIESDEGWTPPPVPHLGPTLRRLRVPDSTLECEALRDLEVLLSSSRVASAALEEALPAQASLRDSVGRLVRAPELEAKLVRSLAEGDGLADSASPRLRRLRSELRSRRLALVERLERYARGVDSRYRVPDSSVTGRSGRYCIPIRREGRGPVRGIVHDESGTGQTLFVEPPEAIEEMNAIRELEISEAREIRRILHELTEALRPLAEALERSFDLLTELDSLYARCRYALRHGAVVPEIGIGADRGSYRVVDGRHPLLLAGDEPPVPFGLELSGGETVLLVSGPNAGGKTVLLKSIGLFSLMVQSGILPPAGPGTRLPVFRRVFAMIGDEQSIEASLSTFGAQVANLKEIVEEADGASLILLDEIGGNTDPAEGGALAAAILTRLSHQAGLAVATTHLGALKGLAAESDSIVNASLQFDSERLTPTFALVRDRPGRSYALEIAGRLGLPEDLLQEARSRLGGGERALESLLTDLERRRLELERLTDAVERRVEALEPRETEVARRIAELDRRQEEVERFAREAAERYLLEARERVEEAIRRVREAYAKAAEAGELEPSAAAAGARSEVERAVREARQRRPAARPRAPARVEEGEWALLRATGRLMRVREVRGNRVTVEGEGLRITVPAHDLEASKGPGSGTGGRGPTGPETREERRPELAPRSEVDLRGLRVEEVVRVLVPALDAAIYADLPRLRIIHGKGTGAVRTRVEILLDADARILRFRSGDPEEGGAGVTVVEFHEDET